MMPVFSTDVIHEQRKVWGFGFVSRRVFGFRVLAESTFAVFGSSSPKALMPPGRGRFMLHVRLRDYRAVIRPKFFDARTGHVRARTP